MIRISEIESAKSIADLRTSYSIIGVKLQTDLEVLDSKIASVLQKIINRDLKNRVLIQETLHRHKALFSREGESHG